MQHWPRHLVWIAPLAAMAALATVYLFPPAQYGFYPQCALHSLTGLSCPGCGSIRSVHHLLHGEIAAAFQLNPLMYVLLPALVICRNHLHKPVFLWSFVAVVVAFTIARNL